MLPWLFFVEKEKYTNCVSNQTWLPTGSSATIVSVSTNETKKLDASMLKTANSSEEQNSKSSTEVEANQNDAGKSQTSLNEAAKELSSSNALSSLLGDYDSSESE